MSDADFDAFVEDIKMNGQLVPIWIRGAEVIDGRKRLAACERLGIEPHVINLDQTQDAEAVARALNVLRTHYTPSQRTMFAAEIANATAADAAHMRRDRMPYDCKKTVVTVAEAARESGVSAGAVNKAKRLRVTAAPEVTDAVKAGKLTLHAATQIAAGVPRKEQPAIVAKVIEANKGTQRNTPVAKVLDGTDSRKDRAVPKKPQEQFARAVQMMDVAAEIVAANSDAAAGDARRKLFLETLRHVRTTLTRVINALEIAA